MKRAAIYARVSTLHQSETSIDTQIETCKKFCDSQNFKVIDIFSDKESGAKTDRVNFSQMIHNALEGKYDVIVIDKFDRFYRNDVEDRITTRRLEEKGVLVLSATEGVDVSSPTGRLMRWMISDINAFYRDNLRSEIKRKTLTVVRRGYWVGGNPAYGYKTVQVRDKEGRKRKKVVINEKEAEVVRFIYDLADKGFSHKEIARKLNEKGFKPRKNDLWSVSSVWDILRRHYYDGTLTYNLGRKGNPRVKRDDTIFVPNAIPSIVSPEQFKRVRAKFSDYHPRRTSNHHIFKGLVKCGDCGANMVSQGNRYVCSAWAVGHSVKFVGITEKKLLQYVIGYIDHEILGNPTNGDFAKLARQASKELAKKDEHLKKRIERLSKKKISLQAQIDNIIDAISKGVLVDQLQEKADELEDELKNIDYQIQNIRNNAQLIISPEELKARWRELKKGLFQPEKQESVIRALVKEIIVYPSKYIKIIER